VAGWPAMFTTELTDYAAEGAIAGVSSYGISGTNSHAEVWAYSRYGAHKPRADYDKLQQTTTLCPITMGPIDVRSGEPLSEMDRCTRTSYKANALREELAPYDISSYAYKGKFRYREEDLDEGDDELPPGLKIYICGSWSGWQKFEEMDIDEDGSFLSTIVLGEVRYEQFFLCLNGNQLFTIYPAVDNASSQIWIEGPDNQNRPTGDKSRGNCWLIDGRDERIPMGTGYQIRFRWGNRRKQISWQAIGPRCAAKVKQHEHSYWVVGSWTSWQPRPMQKDPSESGIWTYSFKISIQGAEDFYFARDGDTRQAIYPACDRPTAATIPVRGPDHLRAGKCWQASGSVFEEVKLRLDIDDARITLEVRSLTTDIQVWGSMEGYDRHEYFIVGTCTNEVPIRLEMDVENPGIFKWRGTVGDMLDEALMMFNELFYIIVDEDPNLAIYPQFPFASSGEFVTKGPDSSRSDQTWMVRSYMPGVEFEISYNPRAQDSRSIVTWSLMDVAADDPAALFSTILFNNTSEDIIL